MTQINLVDLIERETGITMKETKTGREWRSPCPIHRGNNPTSFVVFKTANGHLWKCYSDCNETGDAIKFLMRYHNITRTQAMERLNLTDRDLTPIPKPKPQPPTQTFLPNPTWLKTANSLTLQAQNDLWTPGGKLARAWLNARGLTDKTIETWRLGLIASPGRGHYQNPKKWGLPGRTKPIWLPRGITIPCIHNEIWYIKIRRPDPDITNHGGPKLIQIPGGQQALYGRLSLHKTAFITEGEFDTLLLWQEINDLADTLTLGAAGHIPKGKWLRHLLPYNPIIVVGDNDQAGQKNNQKWASLTDRIVTAHVPRGNDITDYWKQSGNLRTWAKCQIKKHSPDQPTDLDRLFLAPDPATGGQQNEMFQTISYK